VITDLKALKVLKEVDDDTRGVIDSETGMRLIVDMDFETREGYSLEGYDVTPTDRGFIVLREIGEDEEFTGIIDADTKKEVVIDADFIKGDIIKLKNYDFRVYT